MWSVLRAFKMMLAKNLFLIIHATKKFPLSMMSKPNFLTTCYSELSSLAVYYLGFDKKLKTGTPML